ncbi:imelysin family protein [Alkalimarinus alittae]|uniref:Imelysin-like domain-containing protein n=1 Tax=Alkalimarinus alittae TaxID=2961619 RepID=A0ABY6N0Y3_9ALTE|nr:imelysin family protein [Alkalimarinus alittae]UZE95744.1 hypothetical protein NKI27_17035 [Alkalimarinus alittae]
MAFRNSKWVRLTSFLLIGLVVCACSNNDPESSQPPDQVAKPEASTANTESGASLNVDSTLSDSTPHPLPLTVFYLDLANQQFTTVCSSAEQLQKSIQLFVTAPTEKGLIEAQSAWLNSHNEYTSTQLFRNININHPVLDQSTIKPVKHAIAIRIDQTPLLPGYIDEVEGYPKSGFIFSPLPIDRETLNKEHQFADSAYVALGFHAVEFLLWGENNRTHTAFLPTQQESDVNSDDVFKVRRSQLLSLTTSMLTEDLATLCKAWNTNTGFYATALHALPAKEQNATINAATEQLISNLQINTAKVRQANDNNEEVIEIEPHSAFSGSDKKDTEAQIRILKALIESKEWKNASNKQEHGQKLTQLAKALLL